MSQTKTIYEFLSKTENRSADKALLLGLRRAEPSYAAVILNTLLDRGAASSMAELLRNCHDFPPQWKDLILKHDDKLDKALRAVADDPSPQVRSNVLNLIERTRRTHLADVAAKMLRDRVVSVARQAGATLVHLASSAQRSQGKQTGEEIPAYQVAETLETSGYQKSELTGALEIALRNYGDHGNRDAVLAAMMTTSADEMFWSAFLEPNHPVARTVKELLLKHEKIELAGFYLSALTSPQLRVTAMRAISRRHRTAFVVHLARAFAAEQDEKLIQALKLIRQPVWLSKDYLALHSMTLDDKYHLIDFICHLGADPGALSDYLVGMLQEAPEALAFHILHKLMDLPQAVRAAAIAQATGHACESVAVTALQHVIAMEPPDLHLQLIRLLSSPHAQVRAVARRHCQSFAFNVYWRNFDQLSKENRRKAGDAVFKIDPTAQEKWANYFQSPSAELRLRATRMARILQKTELFKRQLLDLSRDSDRMVRSCAIAALGQTTPTDETRRCLIEALRDKDTRVQANAIEAIEEQKLNDLTPALEPLMQSSNNRLRANAIKTLLTWKVASAQQAIEQMVSDSRSQHRRSAQWLISQLKPQTKQSLAALADASLLETVS